MNRRDFFRRTMAFLPVPAFARAASLWLPPEKPFFVPETLTEFKVRWVVNEAKDLMRFMQREKGWIEGWDTLELCRETCQNVADRVSEQSWKDYQLWAAKNLKDGEWP